MASNMQPSGPPQPPRPPMMGSSGQPQNLGPPMPMQFRPVVPSQQPPQFMPQAPQQFRPVGQPMPGANIGMPGQMPHFPQPGQHLPHSSQVPLASHGVPMAYQPARPMSSAPVQPQQQDAYPGGHLFVMGAPMQPTTYAYQPTWIPRVVQPWGAVRGLTLGRSHSNYFGAPHMTPLVQPGHQRVPATVILPSVNTSEPSSSDWQEHTASEGKKYYYNKKTRQSSWEKPAELMTPLERADASTEWKEFNTPEGRNYYLNKVTKQSKWSIPDELKPACELAEKTSTQQSDQETGLAAIAPVGSAASEPSVPANQSSIAVGLIASSSHDASANSVPLGGGSSHNVDNTSSSSVVGMQNGGPSTAVPVTISTEVQLVATEAGSSRNNKENSSVTTAADTENGTSAEDLEVSTYGVIIQNLPHTTLPSQLARLFQQFGDIKPYSIRIKANENHCCAYLEFEHLSGRQKAIEGSPISVGTYTSYVEEATMDYWETHMEVTETTIKSVILGKKNYQTMRKKEKRACGQANGGGRPASSRHQKQHGPPPLQSSQSRSFNLPPTHQTGAPPGIGPQRLFFGPSNLQQTSTRGPRRGSFNSPFILQQTSGPRSGSFNSIDRRHQLRVPRGLAAGPSAPPIHHQGQLLLPMDLAADSSAPPIHHKSQLRLSVGLATKHSSSLIWFLVYMKCKNQGR